MLVGRVSLRRLAQLGGVGVTAGFAEGGADAAAMLAQAAA
jgi:hypothetical protein